MAFSRIKIWYKALQTFLSITIRSSCMTKDNIKQKPELKRLCSGILKYVQQTNLENGRPKRQRVRARCFPAFLRFPAKSSADAPHGPELSVLLV